MSGETSPAQGRVAYFDALRVFASFAVMALHLAAQHWADTDVNSAAWQAFNAYDALTRWCVPVFVMISGALFLRRPISLKKLYGKHVARLAAAFVFWSLLYAAVSARRYALGRRAIWHELTHGHYHMWFLYMIAGLYLLVPLLYQLVQSAQAKRYFLLLALLFGFALPEAVSLLSYVAPTLGEGLQVVLQGVDLRFVMGYSGYFVLGYALANREPSKREERVIYALGVLGFAATALGTRALSLRASAPEGLLYGYCTVNVLCEAVAVFTFFRQHIRSSGRLLRALSDASFGAYLVHALLIDTLQFRFGIDTLSLAPALSVPLLATAVFFGAYVISLALKRVPLVQDWLV